MTDPNAVFDQSRALHQKAMMKLDGVQQMNDLIANFGPMNVSPTSQPSAQVSQEGPMGMTNANPFDLFSRFRISQGYGNYNPALYAGRTAGSKHWAVDIATPEGTPVYSPVSGKVEYGEDPTFGKYARVIGDDGVTYQFSHLSKFGDGKTVGYTGSTGHSTGPHLDIMTKKDGKTINPMTLESLKRAV